MTQLCAAHHPNRSVRSLIVTGFGCRPYTELDAGATGPAFESRQGRKTRVALIRSGLSRSSFDIACREFAYKRCDRDRSCDELTVGGRAGSSAS